MTTTNTLQMQLDFAVLPEKLFHALVDQTALQTWFAEHAEITTDRYDFWGRFTPENPTRKNGHHPILDLNPPHSLRYHWHLRSKETTVELHLMQQPEATRLVLRHTETLAEYSDIAIYEFEDFWFLAFENLRRYLTGQTDIVRCDFSDSMTGNIKHSIDIEAPAETVFGFLITPDQLNRWIASNATVTPKIGGEINLGWEGVPPTKILELQPNAKLVTGWDEGQIVTWTLAESGGKTRLTIVHSGFEENDNTAGLHAGWLNYIVRIRALAEKNWDPPLLRLAPQMTSYYAKSIIDRQAELA